MKRMVIKPTVNCTANCCGCVSRRALHRSFARNSWLSPEQWISVINQAADLGLEDLHISGGEPTLFPHLVDLIREGKSRGLRVRINTNGSLITPDPARHGYYQDYARAYRQAFDQLRGTYETISALQESPFMIEEEKDGNMVTT